MKTGKLKQIFVIFIVLLFFSSCGVTKQEQTKTLLSSNSLVGVWNQVIPTDKDDEVVLTGIFKFINPDKTFYMMMSSFGDDVVHPAVIRMYGHYEITSKDTLIEYVDDHFIPQIIGSKSELKYELLDDDTLKIKYKNTVTQTWITEFWIRVKKQK